MKRYITAMAAGLAVIVLAGAHPAAASQCTQACDQAFGQCDKAGGQDCLPKWGQCKRTCSPPAQSKPTTQTVSTKPTPPRH